MTLRTVSESSSDAELLSRATWKRWFGAAGRFGSCDPKAGERLLEEHKGKLDINAFDELGNTALQYAVTYGHADAVAMLLRRGASVNALDRDSRNCPLWLAINNQNDASVLTRLIGAGARVNELTDASPGCPTALHLAARDGFAGAVRVLLEAGADATVRNVDGKTPAELAADRQQDSAVAVFKEFSSKHSPGLSERFCPSLHFLLLRV